MIFSGIFSKGGAGQDTGEISHDDFVAAIKAKTCRVIDVREHNEYAAGHVPGAQNHPLSRFDAKQLPSGKPVVLVCKSGGRSATALSKARAAGRTDVRHYRAGTMGWCQAGGELEG
jgi:rhodanese-related sulfurtransferase